MLLYLNITNFALIKETNIQFHKGLNVLSGETGSGKSILFEALGVSLGERASKTMIKAGENNATIEACFTINEDVKSLLKTMGCHAEEDTVIIRRDLFSEYPSVSRVNGYSVTLNDLKNITRKLCDIFGQYEHQLLLDSQNYLSIIDAYLKDESKEYFDKIRDVYLCGKKIDAELAHLRAMDADPNQDMEYLEYKIQEIERADLREGEDEEVFAELQILENHKSISEQLGNALLHFDGDFHSPEMSSILGMIQDSKNAINSISQHDVKYQRIEKRIEELYYEAQDIQSEIQSSLHNLVYDEERRNELNDRLQLITSLKRKYGSTIQDIFQAYASLKDEVDVLKNKDFKIKRLEEERAKNKTEYQHLASKLTELRQEIAVTIQNKIQDELREMEMKDVVFKIQISHGEDSERGSDTVEFLVSTNRGGSLKPIREIISGGEMSRFMLAFKNVLAEEKPTKTFVFDEIDTGLSGKAANSVGKRLKDLSMNRQVLLISHLPQIISKADHHFKIQKESIEDDTISKVIYLDFDARVEELARLLSGDTITDTTLENAKQLLKENEVSNGLY
ncbi:MAG: DNA repair protein RecN [Tissierellia bacterium]|nr:DNA repair protein RecN [Tissierellia bacterium]